ncbi:MAG: response regulator [Syntrophomonas sp.]|nr:response regulator [Syntrophomonas sp.]
MKKVLVVNDSRFERKIMRDMLINLGYEVKTTNEYEVLILLDSFNPDIVIANMNMTNITGDRLIQNIKERRPTTKCYLSSCSEISPEYSQNQWIDGVFATPINPGSLVTILEKEEMEKPKPLEEVKDLVANCSLEENFHDENDVTRFTFCPYCGNTLSASSGKFVFCPFCGTKI